MRPTRYHVTVTVRDGETGRMLQELVVPAVTNVDLTTTYDTDRYEADLPFAFRPLGYTEPPEIETLTFRMGEPLPSPDSDDGRIYTVYDYHPDTP